MNILVWSYLLISFIILLLGNYVYYQKKNNSISNIFSLCCFFVFAYSFSQFMQFQTNSYGIAYIWIKSAEVSWIFALSAVMHFILIFTKRKQVLKNVWVLPVIYGLASVVSLFATISPIELIKNVSGGYIFSFKSILPFVVIHIWAVIGGFSVLFLCAQFFFKSKGREKYQAKYVFAGLLIPEVLGTIGGFAQQININMFHLNAVGLSSMILIIGYAILEYELFEINPRIAADEIISTMSDSVILFDWRGKIASVNEAVLVTLGYAQEELFDKSVNLLFRENRLLTGVILEKIILDGKISNFEMTFRTKSGKFIPIIISLSAVKDKRDNIIGIVGVAKNIAERKKAEALISRMSYFDTLTNIPNRRLFTDRLNQTLANAKRNKKMFSMLYIGLDEFKLVNDSLGHDKGDLLLKSTVNRLTDSLREIDTVARMNGDEFAIILSGINTIRNITDVAEKIIKIFSKPFIVNDHDIYLTATIGISVYPSDGKTAQDLIFKADSAMHNSKEKRNKNVQFYSEKMHKAA